MKKSLLALTTLGVAAMVAPTAQASGSPFVVVGPIAKSADGSVQVAVSDGQTTGTPGGWCNNGQPSSVIAVRSTGKARTLYVTVTTDSGNTNKLYTLKNVDSHGAFVLPLAAGSGVDTTFEVGTSVDPDGAVTDDGATWTYGTALAPNSCAGLPTQLPNLPSAWATPGSTPTGSTTPAPVKTTTKPAPVKTTTKPAPVKTTTAPTKPAPATSSASATVTVKASSPAGTKTSSTSGVIPVTKPVPPGGVTATQTVKAPGKGVSVTATATVKPITSSAAATSSSSAIGPKVQTDGSSANNIAALELMGATAVVALGGGVTVAARRRR